MASKTCASSIRGQYYGIAAAIGKNWCLCGYLGIPSNSKHYAYSEDLSLQVPFYVSSALCLFSAFLTIFFVPPVGQDAINKEDRLFKEYLEENGFDIRLLGDSGVVTQYQEDEDIGVISDEKTIPLKYNRKMYNRY